MFQDLYRMVIIYNTYKTILIINYLSQYNNISSFLFRKYIQKQSRWQNTNK